MKSYTLSGIKSKTEYYLKSDVDNKLNEIETKMLNLKSIVDIGYFGHIDGIIEFLKKGD